MRSNLHESASDRLQPLSTPPPAHARRQFYRLELGRLSRGELGRGTGPDAVENIFTAALHIHVSTLVTTG